MSPTDHLVTVVGGGMAGSEAAWQLAQRGIGVRLHEMRPSRPTPVHKSYACSSLTCGKPWLPMVELDWLHRK